jgi:hypothetical protein
MRLASLCQRQFVLFLVLLRVWTGLFTLCLSVRSNRARCCQAF